LCFLSPASSPNRTLDNAAPVAGAFTAIGLPRDGLLPGWFGALHPRWRTPFRPHAAHAADAADADRRHGLFLLTDLDAADDHVLALFRMAASRLWRVFRLW
jgi:amino acid transporter